MDIYIYIFFLKKNVYSRMRSEGFSFNSGGLGVEPCSRPVVSTSATVRNRPQPFATVRNRPQPFAESAKALPLGEAFGEGFGWRRDVSDSCEIARNRVERFAFQGVASKLCFRDKSQLKWRVWWMGVCSERVEIIPNVWCGANFVEALMR